MDCRSSKNIASTEPGIHVRYEKVLSLEYEMVGVKENRAFCPHIGGYCAAVCIFRDCRKLRRGSYWTHDPNIQPTILLWDRIHDVQLED